jgi:hypothetical protein
MSDQDGRERGVLDRRHFLKVAALSGSALAAAGLIKLIDPESLDSALADLGNGPYFYGTDSSWAVDTKGTNASGFPQNFYIGKTGAGVNILYDTSGFHPGAADKAGKPWTHTFWELKGPYYKYAPQNKTQENLRNYGINQGNKAVDALSLFTWADKIGGKTIFADIERGKSSIPDSDLFDGWRYFINGVEQVDTSKNRAVLEGYLDTINGHGPSINPGIYTRLDLWNSWFDAGTNYSPEDVLHQPIAFVVWLAGNACSISCSPCGTCTYAKSQADSKFNTKKETTLGRYKTVIWQFYTDACPAPDCADYDIAQQNGTIRFTPIKATYLPLTKYGNRLLRSSDPTDSSKTYPPP